MTSDCDAALCLRAELEDALSEALAEEEDFLEKEAEEAWATGDETAAEALTAASVAIELLRLQIALQAERDGEAYCAFGTLTTTGLSAAIHLGSANEAAALEDALKALEVTVPQLERSTRATFAYEGTSYVVKLTVDPDSLSISLEPTS